MSNYVVIMLFNTTIFNENPIAMNYDRYGEESSRKNWCGSKEEFESCLSSCYRFISCMEKGNVNCPSMCINACNRLQSMNKCTARLFTDIFRTRERKYATKFLYEEYNVMERKHISTGKSTKVSNSLEVSKPLDSEQISTDVSKSPEVSTSSGVSNPLLNKLGISL